MDTLTVNGSRSLSRSMWPVFSKSTLPHNGWHSVVHMDRSGFCAHADFERVRLLLNGESRTCPVVWNEISEDQYQNAGIVYC